LQAVAKAFDCEVEHHKVLVDMCRSWFKKDNLDDPCFKLALVPSQAKLNFGLDKVTGKRMLYPLVSVENVFIFPGIPELLRRAFTNLEEELFTSESKFFSHASYFSRDEISLTAQLNQLVLSHPQVTFGSYPTWTHQYYRTKITLEAPDKNLVDAARSDINQKMNPINYDPSPAENAFDKIKSFASDTDDESLRDVINKSLEIVEESFTRYKPENVSVCFNGGKDCVVMLHIVHAVHQKLFPDKQLKSFYVSEKKTFSEVDSFIEDTIGVYKLSNKTYEEPMKTALAQMLDEDKEVLATMLGVRTGDPGDSGDVNVSD